MSSAGTRDQHSQMRAENRQTHMLFGVATIFIVGHSLRIALNVQELHWLVSGRGVSTDASLACEREGISWNTKISLLKNHLSFLIIGV